MAITSIVIDRIGPAGGAGTLANILANANVFTNVNTFAGLRVSTKSIGMDTDLTSLDFNVLVDASGTTITINLPAATGSGQVFRIKKIDSTDNIVTVNAMGTDIIDDSSSVNLADQWSYCIVIDASAGFWDNAS